ncbi:MAG: hypothetical protein HY394_01465 [Candidatus Diapherotrites archaeon]|nr:hypothetical protein [Candidatus Diapherotrites archaeon]
MADFVTNLIQVLTLVYLVWIFRWASGQLGSAKLAIIFSLIVVYLTFFQFPELVWIPAVIFLFATFGKELFAKMA